LVISGKTFSKEKSVSDQKIPLTEVPRALAQHGVKRSYHQIWRLAVSGEIEAERDCGKWMVDPANLPAMAKSLSGE
jgi:hypothetical protein